MAGHHPQQVSMRTSMAIIQKNIAKNEDEEVFNYKDMTKQRVTWLYTS